VAIILVLEEDPQCRRAFRGVLTQAGYAVMEARHAVEAIYYAQQYPIALGVVPLLRPVPLSLATLRSLRTVAPRIRLLALWDRGRIGALDGQRLAQVGGADRVLGLPGDEAHFLGTIQELLAESPGAADGIW
jgi:DNA-binding response OmpR family regulator